MHEVQNPRTSLFYGLNPEDAYLALWKLLFSPSLRKRIGLERSFAICDALTHTFTAGDNVAFSALYASIRDEIRALSTAEPRPSMDNPPWSMISLDMQIGIIPWVSPLFDRFLLLLLSTGSMVHKQFGEILPIAFVLSGGPGDAKDSAIRICAPGNGARVSAEYWLMRAFLWIPRQGSHFTLPPDENGRTFSMHTYTDSSGQSRNLFFETTTSSGREDQDFLEFLHEK